MAFDKNFKFSAPRSDLARLMMMLWSCKPARTARRCCRCSSSDEQFVKVDIAEGKSVQYLVNKALKGLSSIAKIKGHAKELKKAKRDDDNIWYVSRLYQGLMVFSDKVKL